MIFVTSQYVAPKITEKRRRRHINNYLAHLGGDIHHSHLGSIDQNLSDGPILMARPRKPERTHRMFVAHKYLIHHWCRCRYLKSIKEKRCQLDEDKVWWELFQNGKSYRDQRLNSKQPHHQHLKESWFISKIKLFMNLIIQNFSSISHILGRWHMLILWSSLGKPHPFQGFVFPSLRSTF